MYYSADQAHKFFSIVVCPTPSEFKWCIGHPHD